MKSTPRLAVCEQGAVLIPVCGSVSAYDRGNGLPLWSGKATAGGNSRCAIPTDWSAKSA